MKYLSRFRKVIDDWFDRFLSPYKWSKYMRRLFVCTFPVSMVIYLVIYFPVCIVFIVLVAIGEITSFLADLWDME